AARFRGSLLHSLASNSYDLLTACMCLDNLLLAPVMVSREGAHEMKRIIDGVTYNTDTSTRLAQSEYETEYSHEEKSCIGTLYQTRGGAFFVHEAIDIGWVDEIQEDVWRN